MAGGTYADEDPGASVGKRLANSVRKIGAQLGIGQTKDVVSSDTGETSQEAADRMSGDDGKIGRMKAAQSTDRDNSYSF
jgi:hypothetical protein